MHTCTNDLAQADEHQERQTKNLQALLALVAALWSACHSSLLPVTKTKICWRNNMGWLTDARKGSLSSTHSWTPELRSPV